MLKQLQSEWKEGRSTSSLGNSQLFEAGDFRWCEPPSHVIAGVVVE